MIGTCVVRRHDDGTCEVLQADDVIAISRDLLRTHDESAMRVRGDGDEVTICGEYVYRATGEWYDGEPVYRLATQPDSGAGK